MQLIYKVILCFGKVGTCRLEGLIPLKMRNDLMLCGHRFIYLMSNHNWLDDIKGHHVQIQKLVSK